MPTTVIKSEMLASWVYRHGELARHRLVKKIAAIAFIAGLILVAIVIYPLFFGNEVVVKNSVSRAAFIIFLLFVAAVYFTPKFFSGLLIKGIKKIIPVAEEEVIITSAKIITEKKTWMLNNEKKILCSVEWDDAANPGELIFRGKELMQGKADRRFSVRLPVPPNEYQSGEKIYHYFKQLLGGNAGPENISV
jgi:hypothetical protein